MCDKNELKDIQDKEKTPIGKIIFWSVIGVLVVWALTFVLFPAISNSDERGQFGDMFGAVNALFSGLAFAGLIITLILQRQELGLQREELEQTREELKNQRAEFEKENETLKYQRFENLFYNMLNLQQKIVESLKYSYSRFEDTKSPSIGGIIKKGKHEVRCEVVGRDVFRFIFNENLFDIEIENRIEPCSGYRDYLKYAGLSSYGNTSFPTMFDHYFRHLFQILEFVDNQEFKLEDSNKYVSFLKATLSRYEMVWIYYHALQPENQKCKQLIEKYSFLEGLRGNLLTFSIESDYPYDQLWMLEDDLENDGFSHGDFEYYLTEKPNDPKKYYLSAFWNKENIEEGKNYIERWKDAFDNKYSDEIRTIMLKVKTKK